MSVDAAAGSARVTPARPGHPGPPPPPVAQIHRPGGGGEHQRAGHQIRRGGTRVQRRVRGLLGERDVAGVGDERAVLRVGHRVALHREPGDRGDVHRRLLRVEPGGAHPKRPAGKFDQLREHGVSVGPGAPGPGADASRQSRANAAANSLCTSAYGSPDTSTVTSRRCPPVNGYGAAYALDTAWPVLRPTLTPPPARANAPGWVIISGRVATTVSSRYSDAVPIGVGVAGTVPDRS